MELFKLKQFTKGWMVGDFEPNIIRTNDFEFGVKYYRAGDTDEPHLHKVAEEITVIISGKFEVNGSILTAGDVMRIRPNEISRFKCLEDGANAIVKIPSVKGDKYGAVDMDGQ